MRISKTNQIIDLSIIIPAYREEAKIALDILAASNYLKERNLNGELIVVDDGSPDNTSEVARKLSQTNPCVKVISYKINKGKGYAIRTGVKSSMGKYIMFADTGLCVPYEYADKGLEVLKNGADIALGSRRYLGAEIVREQPLYRKIGSKVFWSIIKRWLSIPKKITDTQCGFKLFNGDIARQLYNKCMTDGFMIDIEMLCRAEKNGIKVQEFPVKWSNDADTRYNAFTGTIENFTQLCKIWLSLRNNGIKNNEDI